MAKQPRLDLPGIPQHVVQRSNHRLPCSLDDHDRHRYRHLLREAPLSTGCALHAYVLMANLASKLHLLGPTSEERAAAYREPLREVMSDDDLAAIRTHLKQQRALRHDAFQEQVEAKTQRFAGVGAAHALREPSER